MENNYYDTPFYNVVLPVVLIILSILAAGAFVITQNYIFIFLLLGMCVFFKFMHWFLEQKTNQKYAEQFKTQHKSEILSDYEERELLRIKEEEMGAK